MRVISSVVIGLLAAAAGCASLIGLETTTTIAPDAASDVAVADAGAADATIEAAEDPADGEVTDASAEACAPPSRVSPSTVDAVVTTSGDTCGLADSVLDADGLTFGLDYNPSSTTNETWDTRYVTGCVGLGFTGGPFRALTVRARATPRACTNECTPGGGCGTGQWFGLFVRVGNTQKWITTTAITGTLADYTIALPPSIGADPYLYVCRSSANRTRDDVEVDYVAACR